MSCYTFNGVTLTEEELFKRIKAELKDNRDLQSIAAVLYKLDSNPIEILNDIKSKGESAQEEQQKAAAEGTPLPYLSVSKYITAVHHPSKIQLTPEYSDTKRKQNWIDLHKAEYGNDTTKAAAAYAEEVQFEADSNKVGTYVHELVHVLLDTKLNGTEHRKYLDDLEAKLLKDPKLLKAITEKSSIKDETDAKKAAAVKARIDIVARKVYGWVKSLGPNCEIFSEIPMFLRKPLDCENLDSKGVSVRRQYGGILGIADLIVYNKDTKELTLIDYKVSGSIYDEWSEAKKNEVDYQLALYRAMLSESDINGADIKILIKPILYEKSNITSLDIAEEAVDRNMAQGSGSSRIAWVGGSFTSNLRHLGIGAKILWDKKNDAGLSEAIDKDLENMLTYEDPVVLSKLYLIDHNLHPKKDDLGRVVGYKMRSRITNKDIEAKTKEEFTKEDGLIDNYIKELKAANQAIGKTIVSQFLKYKEKLENGEDVSDMKLLDVRNESNKALLERYIGRYVKNGWDFEPISDELLDRGILLFSRQDGKTGKKLVDIVTIALSELTDTIDIDGSQNVLGKFYDDEQVKNIGFQSPLRSYYQNVKAVETAVILNTLASRDPGLFDSVSFGRLTVINPHKDSGEAYETSSSNLSDIMDNFGILCKESKTKNYLTNVKVPSTVEYVMQEAFDLLAPLKEDKVFKLILKDISNDSENIEVQRQAISRLMKLLETKYNNKLSGLKNGKGRIDFNDEILVAWYLLAQIHGDLMGMKVSYTGRATQWAISISELMSLFGVAITGKQAQTDIQGDNISGLGNGLETSSPRTAPAENIRRLNAAWSRAQQEVRTEFTTEIGFILKLDREFTTKMGGSHMLFNASYTSVWEHLLRHENGIVSSDLKLKNPYDKSNDLIEDEREFLKQWLWEVNKWKITTNKDLLKKHYKGNEKEIEGMQEFKNMIDDDTYFNLPLVKSSGYESVRATLKGKQSFKDLVTHKWDEFEEMYSPNGIHNARRKQMQEAQDQWMYDQYDLSEGQRKDYIASQSSPYNFSFDLDFLALDVALNKIRKKHYDETILLHLTLMTLMTVQGQMLGEGYEEEKAAAENQLKIMKGDSLLTKGEEKIAKPVGGVRQLNSFVMLACRPLQFLKELSFGLFTNYSRAWALKMGDSSNALSVKSVTKASALLWGQKISKWGKSITGSGNLADFYLYEKLNDVYGIANADLIRASRNAAISSHGMINNASRWMYIAQSAPDYYNRMTLFLAKMIEDGCLDAHELQEDGNIKYDWKKDKRFSELATHGLNGNYSSPEYNKQKALYVKMCEEFRDPDLIRWVPEKKRYEYGDLKEAYTTQQRDSIKEVSDMAYGFYDHETKSQINHKFVGLMFLQFQTYLSAMYNRWFKGSTVKGMNTAQGKFIEVVKDGVKYYNRHVIGDDGRLIRTEIVPETALTAEEKRTCLPAMQWEGDFVEGMAYSILYTLHDIFTFKWKDIANNKLRLANVMLALHDILFGIILVSILQAIFSGGSGKTANIKPLERVLLRGMQDVGPQALTLVSITPSFISTLLNIKADGVKLLTGSDSLADQVLRLIGATRDWVWEEV